MHAVALLAFHGEFVRLSDIVASGRITMREGRSAINYQAPIISSLELFVYDLDLLFKHCAGEAPVKRSSPTPIKLF